MKEISVPFFGVKKLVGSGIFHFIDFALEASFEVSLCLVDFDKYTLGWFVHWIVMFN